MIHLITSPFTLYSITIWFRCTLMFQVEKKLSFSSLIVNPRLLHSFQIQLSNLVNLLGFEDKEEAITWCQCHGLPVDLNSETITFERTTFIEMPEKFPSKRRSHQLIERKRNCPVSVIIGNGQLPVDPSLNHCPHDSFDSTGVLLKEAWMAEDQGIARQSCLSEPREQQHLQQASLEPASVVSHAVKEAISRNIFTQVIDSTVGELVLSTTQEVLREHAILKMSKLVFEAYVKDFVRYLKIIK